VVVWPPRNLIIESTFLLRRDLYGGAAEENKMGRGLLLWLIGIPLPIILLIWAFGGLH
jgi:hypothetical protein